MAIGAAVAHELIGAIVGALLGFWFTSVVFFLPNPNALFVLRLIKILDGLGVSDHPDALGMAWVGDAVHAALQ
ncbi:hypothetical protein [Pseudomonas sp. 1 R 17]|uniref:hypothetical protein n=1 Tax=Pseudomonas sp. 1 R 17 TaxID=1844091 RepID=UPI0015B50CDA|nr:hypothetical protein [Pseudomonas sp. 1 R 17]